MKNITEKILEAKGSVTTKSLDIINDKVKLMKEFNNIEFELDDYLVGLYNKKIGTFFNNYKT